MEGSPFNLFGDPDEFRHRMEELSEQMQSSQRVAWADNAIKLAVEMTVASIGRLDLTGNSDEQAMQVRDAIRVLFPEAVTLVREAREGLVGGSLSSSIRSLIAAPRRQAAAISSIGSAKSRAGTATTTLIPASMRRCQPFSGGAASARPSAASATFRPKVKPLSTVCHIVAMPAPGAQRIEVTTWSRRAASLRTDSAV